LKNLVQDENEKMNLYKGLSDKFKVLGSRIGRFEESEKLQLHANTTIQTE
jgi:hypothetical protein|tara:strand:+ start:9688 stop:9837 length:150 start_codon:yes stop_codon:yes gene_type:complete